MTDRNIILAGVGGQGILTIAYVLDNSAGQLGLQFKQAEVHGMAQRGGAVQSHLRISEGTIASDLVPLGSCDLILSVEPVEALRYAHYLSPEGAVVTSGTPYINIPDYPELDAVYAQLEELPRCTVIDAKALARRAKSPRAENTVMIGAAADAIGFPPEVMRSWIAQLFQRKGEKVVTTNLAAFESGQRAAEVYGWVRAAGASVKGALALSSRLELDGLTREHLTPWVELVTGADADAVIAALMDQKKAVVPSAELATQLAGAGSTADALTEALA